MISGPGGIVHGLKGERILKRLHIGERDRFEGKPLYTAIVELRAGGSTPAPR